MGNVHLESFRVCEALEAGAVPIVERRRRYDYFGLLFGTYPFHSVEKWSEAPAVVARFCRGAALLGLHEETRSWWREYKAQLRRAAQADVVCRGDERVTLTRGWGRLAGLREMARHQNLTVLGPRGQLTAISLARRLP